MLYIDFCGSKTEAFGHPDFRFEFFVKPEWFDDPIVKQIVEDIDGAKVHSAYSIEHPIFKAINYNMLSSTCRNLILAYKLDDIAIDATYCGDKAGEWLIKLGTMKKKLTIVLNYLLLFSCDFKAVIVNDGRHISTLREYYAAAKTFIYETE